MSDELYRRAVDPATDLAELADLAHSYPELRPAIAENPSSYEGLLTWLGELGDPAVNAALTRRAGSAQPFADVPFPTAVAVAESPFDTPATSVAEPRPTNSPEVTTATRLPSTARTFLWVGFVAILLIPFVWLGTAIVYASHNVEGWLGSGWEIYNRVRVVCSFVDVALRAIAGIAFSAAALLARRPAGAVVGAIVLALVGMSTLIGSLPQAGYFYYGVSSWLSLGATSVLWLAFFFSWALIAGFRGLGYLAAIFIVPAQVALGYLETWALGGLGPVPGTLLDALLFAVVAVGIVLAARGWEKVSARRRAARPAWIAPASPYAAAQFGGAQPYAASGYGAPGYAAPGYAAPGYAAPGYPAPGYGALGYGPPRTNGFAIAALVLGLIGGGILPIIFGHVARSQIRRTGEQGAGMALAGIILGWFWTAVLVAYVVVLIVIAVNASRYAYGY